MKKQQQKKRTDSTACSLVNAPCPMPHAPCPMPHAPCPPSPPSQKRSKNLGTKGEAKKPRSRLRAARSLHPRDDKTHATNQPRYATAILASRCLPPTRFSPRSACHAMLASRRLVCVPPHASRIDFQPAKSYFCVLSSRLLACYEPRSKSAHPCPLAPSRHVQATPKLTFFSVSSSKAAFCFALPCLAWPGLACFATTYLLKHVPMNPCTVLALLRPQSGHIGRAAAARPWIPTASPSAMRWSHSQDLISMPCMGTLKPACIRR